ncbi:MlaD family protein [Nocardia sp. NPDC052001]|uniref:MlaD family protein n=1 Tax=Nocardia sp. NPDC052001 TaxID=3154853 RepID=UPI003431F0B5
MQPLTRIQPLTRRLGTLIDSLEGTGTAPRSERDAARTDRRWGFAGIAAALVVLAAVGIVYVADLGTSTYTADLADAGSVHPGDPVRVAGITVGKVRSLQLRADRATMTFSVNKDVFVGAQSTLAARMLTVVGGHYVALTPAGTKPLGHNTIPMDHVVLPYSLPQLFQDAIAPIDQVDGDVLRRNLAALQDSITQSPQAIGHAVTATKTIADLLNRQNADISSALSVADQYVSALDDSKQVLISLIRNLGILVTLIEQNKFQVSRELDYLASTVSRLVPVGQQWKSTLEPMAQPVADAIPRLHEIGDKLGTLLDGLRAFGQRLQPLVGDQGLTIDQSGTTVQATAPCIPVPGRSC